MGKMSMPTPFIVKTDSDLKELVPDFMKNRYNDFDLIKEKVTVGDYQSIQKIAHNIKGLSGSLGFTYLGEVALRIERSSRTQEADEILKEVKQAKHYLDNVEIHYI